MLSRSLSDCKSLLLNVMIQVSQFVVEFQEFKALQTQAEQLHSADQAAIVIEGAAVTSKPTEVLGKVRTVSLRKKSYQCIQITELLCIAHW